MQAIGAKCHLFNILITNIRQMTGPLGFQDQPRNLLNGGQLAENPNPRNSEFAEFAELAIQITKRQIKPNFS
jgi:hypothetical protein